jgi:HEAT repeat protein
MRLLVLMLPMVLLLVCSHRNIGSAPGILWLGTVFQALICGLAIVTRQVWRDTVGPAIIMVYVIALSWLILGTSGSSDWFLHLAQAVLLVVPLIFFGLLCLRESGAPALRQARALAARLARRRDWPADLQACRLLPEVKALREALHVDASPALALLSDTRPQVRVAALAALEFRQSWQPSQPEVVLKLGKMAREPEVRAAAVNALANLDDRPTIEALAEFLHDPAKLVRQAASEALLWNTEEHWPWIRLAVRRSLADLVCQDDGPLRQEGSVLTTEAVTDLTSWAAEKGLLALRAALSLGAHYNQILSLGESGSLVADLRKQLLDVHTPAMLRLELARVLHQHKELVPNVLRQLLASSNPAPLRLIAVEALLSAGESLEAVAALHDLARLPNREIALSIADVVQRRLGIPLGLARGEPLPPLQSRQAAEIARRVLLWATKQDIPSGTAAAVPPDETPW